MNAIRDHDSTLLRPEVSATSGPQALGTFSSARLARLAVLGSAVILVLGYCREIYVAQFGLDTVLKNLRHFDLDIEGTLAAWYSSGMLLSCAALLAAIAVLSRKAADADWTRWALLAFIFVFLSADEASAIHEIAIMPLRNTFNLTGVLHFSWVIPAAAIVAAVGMFFLPFLFRQPLHHRMRFIAAGAVFVGGALGMELVSGYYASTQGLQSRAYILSAMTEETMELCGSTMFFVSLLAYLRERFGGFSFSLR